MATGVLENDFVFSGRGVVPWNGIGAVLRETPTSEEAIKAARLTWTIDQVPVFTADNWAETIPGYMANVRSDTKEVLVVCCASVWKRR